MARIRRDDTVVIIAGKDKDKRGAVTSVMPRTDRVVVRGVNIVKRHMRQRSGTLQAGIIEREAPISLSNVMLVCTRCEKPTRVSHKVVDGKKVRVCKQCGEVIDKEGA
jgi:large subunit ribosomal protein L24